METDESRELLESLPELQADETFCFDCNPQVPCFNRCCAELTLPLTLYDVLRLRRHGHYQRGVPEYSPPCASFPTHGLSPPMLRMSRPRRALPLCGPGGLFGL